MERDSVIFPMASLQAKWLNLYSNKIGRLLLSTVFCELSHEGLQR